MTLRPPRSKLCAGRGQRFVDMKPRMFAANNVDPSHDLHAHRRSFCEYNLCLAEGLKFRVDLERLFRDERMLGTRKVELKLAGQGGAMRGASTLEGEARQRARGSARARAERTTDHWKCITTTPSMCRRCGFRSILGAGVHVHVHVIKRPGGEEPGGGQ